MKIIYIVNNINQTQGVQRVVCNLSNYFAEICGYEVTIHSLTSSEHNPFFPISSVIQVVHHGVDWQTLNRLKIFQIVRQIMKQTDVDIVITVNATISDAAVLCKKVSRAKVIVTEHCEVSNYSEKRRKLNSVLYSLADKVVMLTESDCKYYKQKNIIAIPNAIPFSVAKSPNFENKTIISVGRLEVEKGFDLLIDAFQIVHESYPDWKLRIIGDGTQRSKLEQQTMMLGLNGCVELPGFIKDVTHELLHASVNIIPSRTEGFPLAVVEAMECGLPCIVFALPALKEILIDGSGIFVPCGDVNTLAKEIISMISSKEKMIEMGSKAKARAQEYHIDCVCEKWKSLFQELSC